MCDFGISGYLVDSVAKTMDAGCKPYMAVSATLCSLSPACESLLLRNQSVHLHPEIKATQSALASLTQQSLPLSSALC